MIIKFIMNFLPTCLPSGLTVAAPDAFGRIPGVFSTSSEKKTGVSVKHECPGWQQIQNLLFFNKNHGQCHKAIDLGVIRKGSIS